MKTMAHYTNNMQTRLDLPELEYPYSWQVTQTQFDNDSNKDKNVMFIALWRDSSSTLRSFFADFFPRVARKEHPVTSILAGLFPEGTPETEIRSALESGAERIYKEKFPAPLPALPVSPFVGNYIPDLF